MPAIGAIEYLRLPPGQFVGSRIFSPDRVVSIGRALDQGLRLDDEEVSSRHATLRVVDGRLVISDAGSRNGVFVNGRKVQSAKVSSFDEILVGGCRLKIDIVGGRQEEDAASLDQTLRGPGPDGPGSTGTQPPRSAATSTFVPRMAEPRSTPRSSGPTTAQFMRTVRQRRAAGARRPRTRRGARRRHVAPVAARRRPPPAHAPPPHVGGRTVAFPSALRSPLPAAGRAAVLRRRGRAHRLASSSRPPRRPARPRRAGPTGTSTTRAPRRRAGPSRAGAPRGGAGLRTAPGRSGRSRGSAADRVIVDPQAAAAPAEPPVRGARARPGPAAGAAALPHGGAAAPSPPCPPQRADERGGGGIDGRPRGASAGSLDRDGEDAAAAAAMQYVPPPEPAPARAARAARAGVPLERAARALRRDARASTPTPCSRARRRPTGSRARWTPPRPSPRSRSRRGYHVADDEELEEDEVEERDWIEPFSLLENVLRDHPKDAATTEQPAILEMIRYRERRIIDLVRLHRGEDFVSFGGARRRVDGALQAHQVPPRRPRRSSTSTRRPRGASSWAASPRRCATCASTTGSPTGASRSTP